MPRRPLRPIVAASFVVSLAASSFAQAPAPAEEVVEAKPEHEKLACARAFEQAQRLRNETLYLAAREEAIKCANPSCGEAVFHECTKLYGELQEAIPSVVFGAREAVKGGELSDVSVTIDGQPAVAQLDGKPVAIDPGSHVFVFTAPNFAPVERKAVIRAGEKYRQIGVVLGEERVPLPTAVVPPIAAASPVTDAPPARSARTVPPFSYVLGGVSALALGGFVVLRVLGSSDYDQLKEGCAPTCAESDVNQVRRKYTLSYAALGVSAVALAGAVAVYLVQPSEASATLTAAFVGPTRDGVAGGLVTTF